MVGIIVTENTPCVVWSVPVSKGRRKATTKVEKSKGVTSVSVEEDYYSITSQVRHSFFFFFTFWPIWSWDILQPMGAVSQGSGMTRTSRPGCARTSKEQHRTCRAGVRRRRKPCRQKWSPLKPPWIRLVVQRAWRCESDLSSLIPEVAVRSKPARGNCRADLRTLHPCFWGR